MKRFVRALPMSAIRGYDDEVGLFRRRRPRRRRRHQLEDREHRREPIRESRREPREPSPLPRRGRELEREVRAPEGEAQLQRIPAPGQQRPPRSDWGPLTRLSDNMRVQARRGHRAAVVELQPGMYIVAEVPEDMVRPQFGVLPVLAPLVLVAANRAIQARLREQGPLLPERQPEAEYEPPPPRQIAGPVATAAPWVSPDDVQAVVAGCRCKRRS